MINKKLVEIVLTLAIIPYYLVSIMAAEGYYMKLLQKYFIKGSYIARIETTTYDKRDIIAVLEEFNYMGNGNVVTFVKPENGGRPIVIKESDFNSDPLQKILGYETLGMAIPKPQNCTIRLKKNLSLKYLDHVLIHEYLHCMGYEHVENNINDLMAPYYNEDVDFINILNYGKDLEKKLHGK